MLVDQFFTAFFYFTLPTLAHLFIVYKASVFHRGVIEAKENLKCLLFTHTFCNLLALKWNGEKTNILKKIQVRPV